MFTYADGGPHTPCPDAYLLFKRSKEKDNKYKSVP